MVCATANYRHLRESNVDRYGIKMRSLVFDKNIPITILLIRGVLQYYEEASALQGHFKATTLFSNAEEEARMSHILGYDEKKYMANISQESDEETLGCVVDNGQWLVKM